MRLALQPHPESPRGPLTGVEVEVEVAGAGSGRLRLCYRLIGDIARLRVPPPLEPSRTDGLWRSTCFEAFLRAAGDEDYFEFNFSPSGEWAAYRFESYRAGRTELDVPAPATGGRREGDLLVRRVSLEGLPGNRGWHLGLCAVVEDADGLFSYWALAHPPGKPDFHHPACFTMELPAARPA